MILTIKKDNLIRLKFGIGSGTNKKEELLSLWSLLWFAKKRGVRCLQIVGDSKTVIDWNKGKN